MGGENQQSRPTEQVKKIELTLYSNGYKFDFESEPRLFDNNGNTLLLETIQRGELPPFMAEKFPNQKIDLVIKDEKTSQCPKIRGFKLF